MTGAPTGFAGPVAGLKTKMVADLAVKGMQNFVTGGNAKDTPPEKRQPGAGLHASTTSPTSGTSSIGDPCPRCDNGTLEMWRGIEVGHVFKLGTKYSKALNATYLDADGKEQIIFMGCYGIGISRTVAACIEQNHDENGIIFPLPIAPFHCIISAVNYTKDEAVSGSLRCRSTGACGGWDARSCSTTGTSVPASSSRMPI